MEIKEPILSIKDLRVIYETDLETVHAVNGISFDLEKGETLGIVGETGAGKTTTSLAILRLLPERTGKITGGSVLFKNRDLLTLSPGKMREVRGEHISMVFQDPMTALNPVLTVGDQITEALILHDGGKRTRKEIEARMERTLEMVGIPAFRKKEYPHQFSGGMKQRVVIAIALACEPDLLIADEPTTALDVTIQAQVLSKMDDLQQALGTSTIMITHDMGIVARTCDRVAVMYAGEIIEYGSLEDIFTAERHHPYTTGLFGSIPDIKRESSRLKPIPGLMPDPTALPRGCKFSPRCPQCMEICRSTPPPLWRKDDHRISCHLFANTNGGTRV